MAAMIRRAVSSRSILRACRGYHSYPDPSEQPVISCSKSSNSSKHNLDKKKGFALAEKFRLDKPFPDTPPSKPIVSSKIPPTIATKLENGLTVASQEMPGLMASISFVVHTGSAYETNEFTGSTHFLELTAFRTTPTRSHTDVLEEMEKMGGMVHCISTRENILYCIDFLKPNLDMAVDLLADTLLNPTFPDEELEETRTLVELQRENLPSETVSRDLVQRAGYVGQPMGNHHYCPSEIARKVSRETLQKFRKQYYFGDNCVIAAAGIDHEDFVKAVEKKFASLPKGDIAALKRPHSVFTGGQLSEQRVLQEPFVKLAIAFEIGGWKDPLLVPAFVMQQLLGGGKSFSAGGPGKGMYTRLYTEVLNRFYWAEAVESFINVSDPSGILGIDGACEPENMTMMVRTIVDQFAKLANIPVTPEELNRAKNMLKSSMMMQLESRLVVSEDIARQFLTYGYRKPAEVICAEIDAVTAEDIMKVASKMLDGPPAVACVGEDVSHLPSYRDIKQFVQGYNEQMWKAANKK